MLKTHKIALDPNNVQATQFAQHCGYGRVAYNHALADFKAGLAKGDWHSHIDLQHRFNAVKYDKYPWAKDMSQTVSKCAIYNNLKDAIGRWQSGQNRFPKFKSRFHGQSYQAIAGKGETQVEGQRIKYPKLVGSAYVNPFASLALSVRSLSLSVDTGGSLLSLWIHLKPILYLIFNNTPSLVWT